MDYDIIVEKLIKIDKRNKFRKIDLKNNLPNFYHHYDPYDVEVDYGIMTIRFYSISKLERLNEEYSYLNVDLVFATSNGDPIFINDDKVYTCAHGCLNPKFEKIANNFDDFLVKITN